MRPLRAVPQLPRLTLSALVLLSLGGLGCHPGSGGTTNPPDDGGTPADTTAPTNVQITGGVTAGELVTGTRTLQATAEDDSGTVAKVEFFVDTTLACSDTTAKSSGAGFSCSWNSSSLAQGAHQLTAKASDAAGNSTTSSPITFQSPAPNRVPAIDKVTATPSAVDEGSPVTLAATASDPDGDAITYTWSQLPATPAGSFSSATGASVKWTAPILSKDTTFSLKVTVTDARGGSAEATTDVQVHNNPSLNRKPVVDPINPPTGAIAGDTLNLSVNASDPDGDPLTYSWSVSDTGGTLTDETTTTAHWRSGDLGAARSYTFTVSVSDGTDSVSQSASVSIAVPQYARDIQPIWTSLCTSCHSSGGRGGLNLSASASYASLVNVAGVAPCASYIRVKPGQPDNSLLALKMVGAPCGGDNRMPLSNPTYFDSNPGQVTRVRSWILAGAANN